MVLFKICVVFVLSSFICLSMEDPEDQKDIESSVKSEAVTPNVAVADNNSTPPLDITLFPINWCNSVLDVADPWFLFHTYQQEIQVTSSNPVRGLPNWYDSLLNALDPWCWLHTRGISIRR
jgi:hypothetical protein